MVAVSWSELDVVGFSLRVSAELRLDRAGEAESKPRTPVSRSYSGGQLRRDMGLEYPAHRRLHRLRSDRRGATSRSLPCCAESRRARTRRAYQASPACAGARSSYAPAQRQHALGSLPIPDYDDFFAAAHELELPSTVAGAEVSIPFESARGCWWGAKHHCSFCGIFTGQLAFRSKSPERVRHELDALADRYGVPTLFAVDNIMDQRYVGRPVRAAVAGAQGLPDRVPGQVQPQAGAAADDGVRRCPFRAAGHREPEHARAAADGQGRDDAPKRPAS